MKKLVLKTKDDINRAHAAEVYKAARGRFKLLEFEDDDLGGIGYYKYTPPKSGHEMAKESIDRWKKYVEEHPTPKIEYQWKVLKVGDHIMLY